MFQHIRAVVSKITTKSFFIFLHLFLSSNAQNTVSQVLEQQLFQMKKYVSKKSLEVDLHSNNITISHKDSENITTRPIISPRIQLEISRKLPNEDRFKFLSKRISNHILNCYLPKQLKKKPKIEKSVSTKNSYNKKEKIYFKKQKCENANHNKSRKVLSKAANQKKPQKYKKNSIKNEDEQIDFKLTENTCFGVNKRCFSQQRYKNELNKENLLQNTIEQNEQQNILQDTLAYSDTSSLNKNITKNGNVSTVCIKNEHYIGNDDRNELKKINFRIKRPFMEIKKKLSISRSSKLIITTKQN